MVYALIDTTVARGLRIVRCWRLRSEHQENVHDEGASVEEEAPLVRCTLEVVLEKVQ